MTNKPPLHEVSTEIERVVCIIYLYQRIVNLQILSVDLKSGRKVGGGHLLRSQPAFLHVSRIPGSISSLQPF